MSSAAVHRRIAVVTPCNFLPVEQGRILPLTTANNADVANDDWSPRDRMQPSVDVEQFTSTRTVIASALHSQPLCRRSSSSSDEGSELTGTSLKRDVTSRDVKRAVGVVSPCSRQLPVSENEELVVRRTVENSDVAELPFYHGSISSAESKNRLRLQQAGTFLLRDSQSRSSQFPFAISVVVKSATSDRGHIQSIRVAKCQRTGSYYLDCAENQLSAMPQFSDVRSLMNYLMDTSKSPQEAAICLLSDRTNVKMPLLLTQPLPIERTSH